MAEIRGTVEVNGVKSEFSLDLGLGSFQQWGADRPVLGERVDLLEGLASAFGEWSLEHVCETCHDRMLDDGEGYDGECGECADQTAGAKQDEEEQDEDS